MYTTVRVLPGQAGIKKIFHAGNSAATPLSNGFLSSFLDSCCTWTVSKFGNWWNTYCLIKTTTWNKPAFGLHELAAWEYISPRCYIKPYQPCYTNNWQGLYVMLPSPAVITFKYFYKIQPLCTILDWCLQNTRGIRTNINHRSVAAPQLEDKCVTDHVNDNLISKGK